ncbi:MAG TPA: GNAT family N-acetyltransferase [Anaerolineaceae bacterium]|jgi:ribosomal protein S18 acetylase RimI-like enzyme|nr:GNAT family N-acetyltransferase [Anaerolineaceae bacterium]
MIFTIRPLTMADWEAVSTLLAEIQNYHANALPHRFRHVHEPLRSREYTQELLDNPAVKLMLTESPSGEITGFVHVVVQDAPDLAILTPCRYAVVDTLVVAPAYRRQGIGQALMMAAEDWARSMHASRIQLNVFAFNLSAQALYAELGYAVTRYTMEKPLD